MLNCKQFASQSVYQHGISVQTHLRSLLDHLENGSESDFRIPDWLLSYKAHILANLHDQETVSLYTLYHDCGKPFCLTEDSEGKQHFPDHAQVSRETFLAATGNEVVANLIGWDMVIHTASAEELDGYLAIWTPQDACTLLLAALSEIHANARVMNGMDSTSFKMKWKQLDRRGKKIVKHLFGSNP